MSPWAILAVPVIVFGTVTMAIGLAAMLVSDQTRSKERIAADAVFGIALLVVGSTVVSAGFWFWFG